MEDQTWIVSLPTDQVKECNDLEECFIWVGSSIVLFICMHESRMKMDPHKPWDIKQTIQVIVRKTSERQAKEATVEDFFQNHQSRDVDAICSGWRCLAPISFRKS